MNGKRAHLLLVLHNHQPVGNFGHVFEEATDRCYHPTLEALSEFPEVRLTLHTTGPLLEWLLANRPDTLALMRSLADRGQIEILGGCHNEAMAAVLPDRDVVGQIATMRRWCQNHLGQEPRGMWLAERVWEPDLPRVLRRAGVEYTLLDDIGFKFGGLTDETVWGHFVTEKAGHPLAIFPIDQQLRYLIPFSEPEAVLDHVRDVAERVGEHVWLTYGDDGEKFGVWPNTYERVFEEGWLRKFFAALTDASDWLGTATLSEATDNFEPRGRLYLPTCSYDEMMEWAQPTPMVHRFEALREMLAAEGKSEAARPFVRGGIWQSFLAKYPEADRMHKRMIAVSERLQMLREDRRSRGWLEEDDHRLFLAQRELYRAQCNDAYWHGLFGGLYLSNLRHVTYQHLISAEVLLDAVDPPLGTPEWVDIDLDGRAECVVSTDALYVAIEPHRGGAISEISYKPRRFCITDTLARRPEHYHRKLLEPTLDATDGAPKSIHDIHVVKEAGLEALLKYDDAPFSCFRDRFFEPTLTAEAWCADGRSEPHDVGDFAHGGYAIGVTANGVDLTRTGLVGARAVRVTKRVAIGEVEHEAQVSVEWDLELLDDGGPLETTFASELCLTLLAGQAPDRYYLLDDRRPDDSYLVSRGAAEARCLSMVCEWSHLRIDLRAGWDAEWWRAPVETVSTSESGIERIYQGSVLLPRWSGRLVSGVPLSLGLTLAVGSET